MRGQDADATSSEVARGAARSTELFALTKVFMLRRTCALMKRYLPSKVEQASPSPCTRMHACMHVCVHACHRSRSWDQAISPDAYSKRQEAQSGKMLAWCFAQQAALDERERGACTM